MKGKFISPEEDFLCFLFFLFFWLFMQKYPKPNAVIFFWFMCFPSRCDFYFSSLLFFLNFISFCLILLEQNGWTILSAVTHEGVKEKEKEDEMEMEHEEGEASSTLLNLYFKHAPKKLVHISSFLQHSALPVRFFLQMRKTCFVVQRLTEHVRRLWIHNSSHNSSHVWGWKENIHRVSNHLTTWRRQTWKFPSWHAPTT